MTQEKKKKHSDSSQASPWTNKRVIFLVTSIILIALAFAVFNLLNSIYISQIPIISVGDEVVKVDEFRERLEFEQALTLQNYNLRFQQLQQQATIYGMDVNQLAQQDQQLSMWGQELVSTDLLASRVIDDILEELLIKEEFDRLGLSINDSAIDTAKQEFFSGDLTEDDNPGTNQADLIGRYNNSVALFYDNLQAVNASQASINTFWERQAMRAIVEDAIVGDIETELFANVRHIMVGTEEEASELLLALESGESFAGLAQANSMDTGSGARGGELGWQAIDLYVPPFANAVEDAPLGELVGPIESEYGFHIIQVIAREERPVDEDLSEQLTQARFATWLDNQVREAEASDTISINDDWFNYLP